ncbi:MAG: phosphatidate cytidylyltransferase [Bacteroidota bacterium]
MSNLSTRIIVALFGIPLIVIISIVGKIPFLIFTLVIALVSYFEFSNMLTRRKFFPNLFIGSASIILIIANSYFSFTEFATLTLAIVPVILLTELLRNRESAIANLGATLIGIFYIGLFASALINVREFYKDSFFLYDQGGYLIISIFASIWICDSAAYFVGSAIGKHKMLTRVSPHKSWEGAIAGLIFAVITMVVAKETVLELYTFKDAIATGLIIGIFGQAGDFIESMIKRDANVKDSSSILPGHGGIFDRFDSLLFSAPLIYLYLSL